MEREPSHVVLPAGSQPRGVVRWGYFLVLNAIAVVIAMGIFAVVLYADALDPYLRGTYDWLLAHPGVTSAMAFSPLGCSLLVGWGYAQRARRRRAAAAKQKAPTTLSAAANAAGPSGGAVSPG